MPTEYSHEATELELYLMNTSDAYHAYYVPRAGRIAAEYRAGRGDIEHAEKTMRFAVNEAAASYRREYGTRFGPAIFTDADRAAVAETLTRQLVDEFHADAENMSAARWAR